MRRVLFALLSMILQTPDATLPNTGKPYLTVEGKGVQIYHCTQVGTAYQWVFQAPEATLLDPKTHEQLGTHQAGPSWTWKDQSSVTGKVAQKTPSPDPASIPWLLLEVHPDPTHTGVLSKAIWIRRSDTHGGNPPPSQTGCDAAHAAAPLRVPYTATYTFYADPNQ